MKRSIGCMIAICILLSSITVNAQIGQFWADGDFKIICDLGIVPKEYREKDIPEKQYVKEIKYVPMIQGSSTTCLINKVIKSMN